MSGLCACVKLCEQYKGFQYLRTCRFFCRMGTCPHELCARYLQQDPDVSMASLTKWPHTQQPKSVSTADVQLRAKQQSAFSQPPAAAGSTLQTLMLRAQTRMQKQVDKDSTKRKGCGYPSRISQKEKRKSTTLPLVGLNLQEASCFRNWLNTSVMVRGVIVFKPS